jgi:hypothetical protein
MSWPQGSTTAPVTRRNSSTATVTPAYCRSESCTKKLGESDYVVTCGHCSSTFHSVCAGVANKHFAQFKTLTDVPGCGFTCYNCYNDYRKLSGRLTEMESKLAHVTTELNKNTGGGALQPEQLEAMIERICVKVCERQLQPEQLESMIERICVKVCEKRVETAGRDYDHFPPPRSAHMESVMHKVLVEQRREDRELESKKCRLVVFRLPESVKDTEPEKKAADLLAVHALAKDIGINQVGKITSVYRDRPMSNPNFDGRILKVVFEDSRAGLAVRDTFLRGFKRARDAKLADAAQEDGYWTANVWCREDLTAKQQTLAKELNEARRAKQEEGIEARVYDFQLQVRENDRWRVVEVPPTQEPAPAEGQGNEQ